jgi:hypothetical protein
MKKPHKSRTHVVIDDYDLRNLNFHKTMLNVGRIRRMRHPMCMADICITPPSKYHGSQYSMGIAARY